MRRKPFSAFVLVSLALCAHPLIAQTPASNDTRDVLLIGNSITYYNEMPWILERVASSLNARPPIRTEFCGQGGLTLKQQWEGRARDRIHEREWDVVVIQAQSTEAARDTATFRRYATLFVNEIKQTGARPVIFFTWQPKGFSYKQRQLDDAYRSLAKDTGAEIAPVGPAFQDLLTSGMDLFEGSDVHPNLAGSYLAACVLFATIYGRSPEGAVFVFNAHFDIPESYRRGLEQEHLSNVTALKIQRAAWSAVKH